MLKRILFPGKYIQGAGALGELPALVKLFGSAGADPRFADRAHAASCPQSGLDLDAHCLLVEPFGGECCERELSGLAAIIRDKHVDVLVGMGGGKDDRHGQDRGGPGRHPGHRRPYHRLDRRARAAGAPWCTPSRAFSSRRIIRS